MNKILSMTFVAVISCATAACAVTDSQSKVTRLQDVAPYPAAPEGHIRNVIWLPEKADEALFKVELVPGKVMQVDCNTRSLIATLTAQDLAGWGYTYYELGDVKGPITTMMACPEGSKKEAFVAAHGDNYTVRYNSKLPIVVYTPADIELRYRIWTGSQQLQSAVQQ